MRITIIGGTEFIGRRTVELLTGRGDDVMVVHRGQMEPADLPPCEHIHVERAAFASVAADLTAFRPDAIVDTIASGAADRDRRPAVPAGRTRRPAVQHGRLPILRAAAR